ncbi:L-lactate dehydrogenase [Thermodesulfitimonas autotrophica]|uniref:L-lactate dehydrogenase n=1 Tax=Thermodesulfitimonas autotrophica TaxID=1894989 RepID=A0A3N5BM46_9THEO|nr:L-lactate dehydrogenase [Thermodesulfitimonas autotrophica]RPF46815.1 L-lactate dehydrogenase [Thermodesulfitimonas autotrophica]
MATIAVIGAGSVGATTAYAIIASNIVEEIVLIDINRPRAEGEALDLGDSTAFTTPTRVFAGDYADCQNADLVIFAAGAGQRPGESRLALAEKNHAVLRDVLAQLMPYWRGGLLLIVSNPVDLLTYAAVKITGLEPSRVLGSGTILDSARFRYALSTYTGVDARNIHAYVIGEHGDSAVPLWSRVRVAGIPLDEFCHQKGIAPPDREVVTTAVRQAAYRIIERKGATYYAIGLGIRRICEAILKDQKSVLTVSGLLAGQYGFNDLSFSLPTVVGKNGRGIALELPLVAEELAALRHSAAILKAAQERLGYR